MSNSNFRYLGRSTYMERDNRQQFEGSLKVRFKLVLLDTLNDYRILVQEVGSDFETVLYRTKSLSIANNLYHDKITAIMNTRNWTMVGMFNGPKRGKSMMFEYTNLMTWGNSNDE